MADEGIGDAGGCKEGGGKSHGVHPTPSYAPLMLILSPSDTHKRTPEPKPC